MIRNQIGQFTAKSWILRNAQLLIILGLMAGIGGEWVRQADLISLPTNEVAYAKEITPVAMECSDGQDGCYLEVLIDYYAEKDFQDNLPYYKEQSRINAFSKLNEAAMARLDESDYIRKLEAQYGEGL